MHTPIAESTITARSGDGNSVYLWLAALSGALGGLLFGYDWVVIGGAKPFYEVYFHLNSPSLEGYSISRIAVDRNLTTKWLFPQERATFQCAQEFT
ncbi:MAG TPA: hypothetical protein VHX20_00540 [Terracidiphilus sp.]|jgi:hypothetical protein|nr:hypothetical protein [Terracidiphilus sp.]